MWALVIDSFNRWLAFSSSSETQNWEIGQYEHRETGTDGQQKTDIPDNVSVSKAIESISGSEWHYRGRVGLGPKVVAQRRGRVRFLENFRNFRYKFRRVASRSRRFWRQGRRVASLRVERPSRRLASRWKFYAMQGAIFPPPWENPALFYLTQTFLKLPDIG